MGIIKCEKGHFYDDVKYDSCPHCKGTVSSSASVDKDEKTIAKIANDKARKSLASFIAYGDERTVGIYSSKGSFIPVVGWLVCIDGKEKGRDYRVVSGRNFIGRAHQMDITISDDPEITRENHCSIVFDPKSAIYNLVPGNSIVYCNDVEVTEPKQLEAYDKIGLGKTVLHFIPYCKEGVCW